MLVGISGPIASGKTTLATKLSHNLNGEVGSFASNLKQLCSLQQEQADFWRVYDLLRDWHICKEDAGDLTDQVFDAFICYPTIDGIKNRRLLQVVGTDIFRAYKENFWIDLFLQQNKNKPLVFVDDVRFDNEVDILDFHIRIDTNKFPLYYEINKSHFSLTYFGQHSSENGITKPANYIIDVGFTDIEVDTLCTILKRM